VPGCRPVRSPTEMRIAVTGSRGRLGQALVDASRGRGHTIMGFSRPALDITRDDHLERLVEWRPDAVVNSAAWTDVDQCAREPQRAMAINGTAAARVAAAAARANATIVQISTNEVFDGQKERPYREDDDPAPINPYGVSKLAGELGAAKANFRCLIVRTAWLFGGAGPSFPAKIRQAAERARAAGQPLRVVRDEIGNPTPVVELALAILQLLERSTGSMSPEIYHLAGLPAVGRLEWARHVLADDADVELLAVTLADYPRDSRVPLRAVLDTTKAASAGIGPIFWRAQELAVAERARQ